MYDDNQPVRMPSSISSLSSITKSPQSSRSSVQHSSLSCTSTDSPPLSYLAPSPPAPSSPPTLMYPSSPVSSSSMYGSSMSSSYSSPGYVGSHESQARQTLTTTPVRLPPPASSRYVMPAQDLGVLGHDADPVNSLDEGSNSMWTRKAVSLGMFYGNGRVCQCPPGPVFQTKYLHVTI